MLGVLANATPLKEILASIILQGNIMKFRCNSR